MEKKYSRWSKLSISIGFVTYLTGVSLGNIAYLKKEKGFNVVRKDTK